MDDIRVGDYVEVAYPTPCCGSASSIGYRFIVSAIGQRNFCRCIHCGVSLVAVPVSDIVKGECDIRRLRKLPPLVTEDKQETEVSA